MTQKVNNISDKMQNTTTHQLFTVSRCHSKVVRFLSYQYIKMNIIIGSGLIILYIAVTAAAREGARAYVEAPDESSARSAATARAMEAMRAHGRADPSRTLVVIDAPDGFARCAPVIVTVAYRVPALTLPFIGGFGGAMTSTATHVELVDPYRDGLPERSCS